MSEKKEKVKEAREQRVYCPLIHHYCDQDCVFYLKKYRLCILQKFIKTQVWGAKK